MSVTCQWDDETIKGLEKTSGKMSAYTGTLEAIEKALAVASALTILRNPEYRCRVMSNDLGTGSPIGDAVLDELLARS